MDNASVFATVAIGAAVLAMVVMIAAAFGAFRSDGADASSPEDDQVADDGAVAASGHDELRTLIHQFSERRFSIEHAHDLMSRCFDELANP